MSERELNYWKSDKIESNELDAILNGGTFGKRVEILDMSKLTDDEIMAIWREIDALKAVGE